MALIVANLIHNAIQLVYTLLVMLTINLGDIFGWNSTVNRKDVEYSENESES